MIKFDSELHKYSLEGKELISVTQLMQLHGLSVDYSAVDPNILKRASEYGNDIHKEAERVIKGEIEPYSYEVKKLMKLMQQEEILVAGSEVMVFNEEVGVAGTIDIVGYVKEKYSIIDIKTTYKYHPNYVSWQLSLYEWLLGEEVDLYCLWLNKENGEWSFYKVERFDVKELLEKHQNGEKYSIQLNENKMISIKEKIEAYQKILDELLEEQNQMLEVIKVNMRDKGIKQFDSDFVKITYTPQTTRTSYDYKKALELKGIKLSPEDFEEIKKVSNVKDRLTITYKEKKE